METLRLSIKISSLNKKRMNLTSFLSKMNQSITFGKTNDDPRRSYRLQRDEIA